MMNKIVEIFTPLYLDNEKTKYMISDAGNILNLNTNKYLSMRLGNTGYYQVKLSHNGKAKHYNVHRLVAMHFIFNPENKPIVNHINGDKTNNDVCNLEWVTYSENNHHAMKIGLVKNVGITSYKCTIPNVDIIHAICDMLEKDYDVSFISDYLNIHKSIINHILYRQSWKTESNNYDFSSRTKKFHNSGDTHYGTKILNEQILSIYKLKDQGYSSCQIKKILNLNVGDRHIRDICSGRRRKKLYISYYINK